MSVGLEGEQGGGTAYVLALALPLFALAGLASTLVTDLWDGI